MEEEAKSLQAAEIEPVEEEPVEEEPVEEEPVEEEPVEEEPVEEETVYVVDVSAFEDFAQRLDAVEERQESLQAVVEDGNEQQLERLDGIHGTLGEMATSLNSDSDTPVDYSSQLEQSNQLGAYMVGFSILILIAVMLVAGMLFAREITSRIRIH